jgi:hypothetical protein
MPKKISKTFHAEIVKNTQKGGAWLALVQDFEATPTGVTEDKSVMTAWSNASAAKRGVKASLLEATGRKSMKFEILANDEAGKPIHFSGSLNYRVDA